MSSALPTCPVPRTLPCKAAGSAMRLLSAWALLVLGCSLAQAQTSTDDPADPTTSSGVTITTGATISINSGYPTNLSGDPLILSAGSLTITPASGTLLLTGSTVTNATSATSSTTPPTDTPLVIGGGITGAAGSLILTGTTAPETTSVTGTNDLTLIDVAGGATITGLTRQGAGTLTFNNTGATTLLINNASTALTFSGISGITTQSGSSNIMVGATNVTGVTVTSGTATAFLPGTVSNGTLLLRSGGVLNLSSLYTSGLALSVGNASTSGGTVLGSTGVSITSSNAAAQGGSAVRVVTLGTLPAGSPSTTASFSKPAVSLFGVGDTGGRGISERGVIYSLTSDNDSPTVDGAGVIKVAHTGLPDASGSFSLTAAGLAPNATYSYRVYATDSTGATYLSPASTFTTPTVLQNWRQTFFGTTQGADNAADNADPDSDGVPNLLEFATGKNPTTAHSTASASPRFNGGSLEYNYTRSLDALNSGVTFIVEWNDTLNPAQWSSSGVTETILSDDGLLQQVKATLPVSSNGRRFVRLKVLPPTAQ